MGGWAGKQGGREGGGVQTRLRPFGAQPCSIQAQEIGILTLEPGRDQSPVYSYNTTADLFGGLWVH